MAIEQMKRLNLCAMKKNKKVILERLQAMGAVEIDIRFDEDVGYEKEDVSKLKSEFERYARTVDHALEVLQKYVPEKTGIFSTLEGKPLIDVSTFQTVVQNQERLIQDAEQIIYLEQQISENANKIQNLTNLADALEPWKSLSVPMSYIGTEKTTAWIGTFPGNKQIEDIWTYLKQEMPEVEAVDGEVISKDKDFTYVFILCLKKEAEVIEEILRTYGFAKPANVCEKTPKECQEAYYEEILKARKEIEDLKEQLKAFSNVREKFRIVSDACRMRAERYAILGQMPQTKNTFLLSGYVPAQRAQEIADQFIKTYDAMVEIEGISEEEEAPVLLKNNQLAEAGEGILASFGLPGKGEIDPTFVMTAFYVFLFGLMLADVAYGLIITIACTVALKKFPRMEDNLKKSLKLFLMCGVSTAFWGVMFGGYFGDAITIISKNFFGQEVTIPALWFVPLNEPMRMLLWSMIFGMIHMYTGLALKAYICIKNKRYMDALCDVGFWVLLLTGLILILVPSDLFASMFQMTVVFPEVVNVFAKVIAGIGAAGILLMSGRDKKGKWGIRIALGAYDLYNITSWLSDALSYSRLLALGLATGVIASVFNQMGSMFGQGVLGTIIFIVVFIVGHAFNLALNLLGTYVHTCRLQYIEFFGKFYEGGGRAFHPFRSNTKYVDIKEEV